MAVSTREQNLFPLKPSLLKQRLPTTFLSHSSGRRLESEKSNISEDKGKLPQIRFSAVFGYICLVGIMQEGRLKGGGL